MKTRLKLYDSEIKVYISKKDKNKLRKVAFAKNYTISQYIRELIRLSLLVDDCIKSYDNAFTSKDYLDEFLTKMEVI